MKNSEETKTHWKKLTNPNYLGAYSLLPGQEVILTIDKVVREGVKGTDGKEEECTVAHFKEPQKPMILNKTNCKVISKIHGTPYIEEWAGKQIQLFVASVKAFGDTVEALRIRPVAPKKPDLNPESPRWGGAKKSIDAGTVTVDQIKKNFNLTKENETLLTAKL